MLKARDIVRNKNTDKVGVVVPTIYLLANEGPLSIIYENTTTAIVIECQDNFEVIGHEEPVIDAEGCGIGQGENACKFCALGENGFRCERHTANHYDHVIAGNQKLREPTAPYPACKLNVN